MLEELTPTHITEFNGLFARGTEEAVPANHFIKAHNLRYISNGFATRYGTSLSLTVAAGVRRFFPFSIEGQVDRVIYLDATGKIFDSLFPATPILNIASMVDFSMIVLNDRAYLSPHDGVTGQAGEIVYVYQGGGIAARPAGGNPPTGFTLVASDSVTAGYVEVGLHLYAVVFETDSGFLTRPGPTVYAQHTSAGAFKVKITNIPIGPAGTISRSILATKAIINYDGDQEGQELFFVETGVLNDNVATEVEFEFYDSQLVRSADYLKDVMTTIPAVLGFTAFGGSLVGWAPNVEPSSVYISVAGEPESISLIEGGIQVEPTTGGGVKNCVAYRGGALMIHKAGRVYSTSNNGQEPVYWEVQGPIDLGVGTSVFGIATILDEEGNTVDKYVVASRKGIIAYGGDFSNVITAKIEDLWARVTKTAMKSIQMALDPIDELIYVAVPLDGATTPNVILFCDYSNGLTIDGVKWSIWNFSQYSPTSIGIDVDADGKPVFKIASVNGNIYYLDESVFSDNLFAIPTPTFETGYVGDEGVAVNYYGGARIRAKGAGVLDSQFSGLDETVTVIPPSILMVQSAGRFYQIDFGLQSQKAKLKGFTTSFGENFVITKISLYSSAFWAEEPL